MHVPDLPEESTAVSSIPPTIDQPAPIEAVAVIGIPALKTKVENRLPEGDGEHAPRMVTVLLRTTGSPERDIRRISRLHGTFISFPGKDRFQFQIFEEGKGHLIDFPNDTTHVCGRLMQMVDDFVGEENVRVEPITYQ